MNTGTFEFLLNVWWWSYVKYPSVLHQEKLWLHCLYRFAGAFTSSKTQLSAGWAGLLDGQVRVPRETGYAAFKFVAGWTLQGKYSRPYTNGRANTTFIQKYQDCMIIKKVFLPEKKIYS